MEIFVDRTPTHAIYHTINRITPRPIPYFHLKSASKSRYVKLWQDDAVSALLKQEHIIVYN